MDSHFWDVFATFGSSSRSRTTHSTFFTHPLERLPSIDSSIEPKQATSSFRVSTRTGGNVLQAFLNSNSPHFPLRSGRKPGDKNGQIKFNPTVAESLS